MAEQANGNSSNTAIIIIAVTAVTAVVVIGGVGGFLYWNKSKNAKLLADPKGATPPIEDKTTSGGDITVTEVQKKDAFEKPIVLIHNKANEIDNSGIGGGISTAKVVKLAGDKTYEYKKQDGVWFTRKIGNSNWLSLKGNATAINTLSKAFPNL